MNKADYKLHAKQGLVNFSLIFFFHSSAELVAFINIGLEETKMHNCLLF